MPGMVLRLFAMKAKSFQEEERGASRRGREARGDEEEASHMDVVGAQDQSHRARQGSRGPSQGTQVVLGPRLGTKALTS